MQKIRRKNGTSYRAKVYINNKAIAKVFKTAIEAKEWKREKENLKKQIENYGLPIVIEITLSDFAKQWLENKSNLQPRSIESYKSALSCYLLPKFGQIYLKDIRIDHAHKLIAELKAKELSQARIKVVIGVFKQLLSDAFKWEYVIHQPFKNLDKIKIPASREVYWLKNEVITFLNANKDSEYYALYVTALNTGLRPGELLGMRWDKVDLTNRQIEISHQRTRHGLKANTKNGKPHQVPINDVLFKTLTNLRNEKRSLDFVFVKRDGETICSEHFTERVLHKAMEDAKVRKIGFRNFRTTFAANYVMSGGDIYVLSKILNHSSVDITAKKYAHLHPSYMKHATKNIAFEADSAYLAHGNLNLVQSS